MKIISIELIRSKDKRHHQANVTVLVDSEQKKDSGMAPTPEEAVQRALQRVCSQLAEDMFATVQVSAVATF